MGNSQSTRHQQHLRHQHQQQQQPQAFASRYQQQHKVLLDLDSTPRLRPTHNGAILHNGGTISQRQRDHFGGSEPDLRFSGTRRDNSASSAANAAAAAAGQLRVSRNNNRKKYRAPPTPQQEWDPNKQPSRRLRLFVTRAEARRKERSSPDVPEPPPQAVDRPLPPTSGGRLRRSLSTPHFQPEERVPPQDQPPANSFLEELRQKQLMREERFRRSESRLSRKQDEKDKTKAEEEWLGKPPAVKTFYFGMDEPVDDPFGFDSFSPKPAASFSSSTESRLSEGFQDGEDSGISVHLRATLPRKQVDIPRFSPAAAWRLLSSAESSLPSPVPPQEEEVVESRILAPPPIQIPALIPDKSADSGISGDASPQQFDSNAWTPQQDLEETSSDGWPADFLRDLKYTPRLSLSLPNKEEPEKPVFTYAKPFPDLDNNWMLSSSIPSSVNQPHQDEEALVKKPSYNYLTAGGHIMYLPEYSIPSELDDSRHISKSCENLARQQPLRLQQPQHDGFQGIDNEKPKKFAFQSTIRQRERKALAEKLARIAEYTEQKRKSEQEVMRKVEEEFQRKREREKADIRQQLRLYNISNRAQLDSLETSISNP